MDSCFSLLLICWGKGQETPIHHHGNKGVLSFVRVLRGRLRLCTGYASKCAGSNEGEVCFEFASGMKPFVIDDDMGLHRTRNVMEEGDCRTVSLHLYTPPYIECRFCTSFQPECTKPGDAIVPVVHHSALADHTTCCEQEVELAKKTSHLSFANFANLVDVLQEEIQVDEGKHSEENIAHVKNILQNLHFNEKEWRQYAKFSHGHYTRNLIGYDEKFTILLLCWEKGQMSPIHDHAGSNCWVKVLDGNLEETVYQVTEDGNGVHSPNASVYHPEQVTYISDSLGVHRMGNATTSDVAVSLHIYSPPYHECYLFDQESEQKKKVCITAAYGAEFPFLESTSDDLRSSASLPDSTSLAQFIDSVTYMLKDKCLSSVSLMLNSLRFREFEWMQYIHFSSHQYTRNLLAFNDYFSLILVCWSPGQKTPVHEHGEDRDVFIRVLQGSLGVQRYLEDEWGQTCVDPDPSASFVVPQGDTVHLHNNDMGLHQTYNASRGNCVSLHLYTPPYLECEFKLQSGAKKLIPVAYCSKEAGSAFKTPSEPLFQFRRSIFSNLSSFVALLTRVFSVKECAKNVSNILSGVQLDQKEWMSIASACSSEYSRTMVAKTDHFSVYVLCWGKGHKSPIHDHGGSESWMKVLEGTIAETTWKVSESGLEMEDTTSLPADTVKYIPADTVHRTSNSSCCPAYTLHVYAPHFDQCNCFDRATGKPTAITCGSHLQFQQSPASNLA